jgi:hypothetical protein
MAHARTPSPDPYDGLSPIERRRREQAQRVGCFTESEVAELSGYSPSTLETYRRRHIGFAWIRVGSEVLYPADLLREHLLKDVRRARGMVADTL